MSTISIIVPCYNQAEYLDECLESVMNQTFQDWECIIVNDGSIDDTEEVAKKWVAKDNRFKYQLKKNGGLSSARNYGIENAVGFYILPLDADDKIAPNYLQVCQSVIITEKNIKVVYGHAIKFGVENKPWILPKYSFYELLNQNVIFCTALFRKADWQRVSGYDENLVHGFEDWDFWISILKDNGKAIQNKETVFYYRTKASSMTTTLAADNDKKLNIRKYIFDKHKEVYTSKNDYQLFIENKKLLFEAQNFYKFFTFKQLFIGVLKRIKFKIYVLNQKNRNSIKGI